mgnify:CR=1 FL=1
MAQPKSKYHSNVSFLDLLFNLVVGFVMLFIIAFILIRPIAENKQIEQKAEYIINVTWPQSFADDVDTWLMDPEEKILSFRQKEVGLMHLDRDDLGGKNDRIKQPDGTIKYVALNREILALRGTVEGWYVVNIHSYRKRDEPNPVKGSVELIQVNPYKVIAIQDFEIQLQGIEKTIWQFEMDDTGNIVDIKEEPYSIVKLALASLSGYWDIREEEEW